MLVKHSLAFPKLEVADGLPIVYINIVRLRVAISNKTILIIGIKL